MEKETEIEESRIPELVDELTSYLYGVFLLSGLAAFMLLIHIGISVYFHN